MGGGHAYLAVYLAGLVVGNHRIDLKRTITTFFGGFTWLVQILMFLALGLLVNPRELPEVAVRAMEWTSPDNVPRLPLKNFTAKARLYISWVGLRGAVPIIFATYALMSPAVEHARFMFNVVFFITILSLIIQGTTVNRMASVLGLKESLRENAFDGVDLPEHVAAALPEKDRTPTPHSRDDGQARQRIHRPEGQHPSLSGRYAASHIRKRRKPGKKALTLRK